MSALPSLLAPQALAFRLESHNLARRLPASDLLAAAGACGLQNTPPGSAALALHARLAGLAPEAVTRALEDEKTLLQAWSLRAAPWLFPTHAAAVFTHGLLPADEAGLRAFISGVEPALAKIGLGATQVVAAAAAEIGDMLAGRVLTKDDLGLGLAARLLPGLAPAQAAAWQSPSPYAAGQSLGESVVRFALPVLALKGLICHAARRGDQAFIARTDEWLAAAQPTTGGPVGVAGSRAALVRRFLHCYGPAARAGFAAWAGIGPTQAAETWALVAAELAEVRLDGQPAWMLAADLPRLAAPAEAEGARLLPPHDPYLQQPDRARLIEDAALRRQVWRTSGNPGLVLAGGRPVGLWRPAKQGRRLRLSVSLFASLPQEARQAIAAEAATLAPFKGCSDVEVRFA